MGPQLDDLREAHVGRRLPLDYPAWLEATSDPSLMADRAVGEGCHSRVILPVETAKLVPLRHFEVAVLNLGGRPGIKNGHAILDEIRLVDDRKALGEIGVLGQDAVAVADREHRRNQLDLGPGRGGLYLLNIAEVKVRHAVEDLKLVVGEQDARVACVARPLDQGDQFVNRSIDLKVEAAINPSIDVGRGSRAELGCVGRATKQGDKSEQNPHWNDLRMSGWIDYVHVAS